MKMYSVTNNRCSPASDKKDKNIYHFRAKVFVPAVYYNIAYQVASALAEGTIYL